MHRRIFLPLVIVLSVGISAFGQPMEFSAPVVVAEVTEIVMPQRVSLFGTVEPFRRSRVATETEGIVEEFPFVEGETVTDGCVVARLRTRILEIERDAAMASLSEASAELARLESGYRPEEIDAARSRLAELKELATDAQLDLERTRELLPDGAATQQDYDKARILLAAARSRVAEVSAEFTLMVKGFRTEEIAKARAQLKQREAQLARIDERISQADVKAPYSGFIAESLTEVGEWLGAGDPVLELIQLDPILVHVDVPERYLRGLKLGRTAIVAFDSLPGESYRGQVTRIIPEADRSARTFPLKIRLPNSEHRLLAGMLARVELEVGEPRVGKAVPKDAIVLSSMGNAVFTVNAGKAKMIPVQVGDAYNGYVAIAGELEVGVPVVIRGNERLRTGQAVLIEPAGHQGPQNKTDSQP
jgi:multidrug efflux pump subunit AcrA (membrane-fusion protein)